MGGTDINNGVSVDLENKIITFPSYAVIVYGNTRIDISNRTFDFSSYNPDFGCIYYDYVTKDFTILDAGRPSKYFESKHLIYIGLVWLTGRYIELNVKPYYFVGGVKRTIDDSRFISIHTNIADGRMAVLGDSISTFTGVSETGSEYWGSFYPNGDVTSVNDMWWEKVRKGLNFSTCSVSAISRSAFKPNSDPKIIYSGADSRITRLAQYGTPKWIFVEMGLNDGFASLDTLGENPYTNDIATLQTNHNYLYSACGETIRKVQNAYPDSKIIVLIPKNLITGLSGTYPMERQVKFCDAIKEMAEEMGVYKIIDLRKCGINVSNAVNYTANTASDGIHPNKAGMQLIANYIIQEMIGF